MFYVGRAAPSGTRQCRHADPLHRVARRRRGHGTRDLAHGPAVQPPLRRAQPPRAATVVDVPVAGGPGSRVPTEARALAPPDPGHRRDRLRVELLTAKGRTAVAAGNDRLGKRLADVDRLHRCEPKDADDDLEARSELGVPLEILRGVL